MSPSADQAGEGHACVNAVPSPAVGSENRREGQGTRATTMCVGRGMSTSS